MPSHRHWAPQISTFQKNERARPRRFDNQENGDRSGCGDVKHIGSHAICHLLAHDPGPESVTPRRDAFVRATNSTHPRSQHVGLSKCHFELPERAIQPLTPHRRFRVTSLVRTGFSCRRTPPPRPWSLRWSLSMQKEDYFIVDPDSPSRARCEANDSEQSNRIRFRVPDLVLRTRSLRGPASPLSFTTR